MFMEQSAIQGPVDHEDESSDDEVSSERRATRTPRKVTKRKQR